MTYAELLRILQRLDPARLEDYVTVYVDDEHEFYAVNRFSIATHNNDTLDPGHAYLEI